MNLILTIVIFGIAVVSFFWARHSSSRPHTPGKLPLISPIAIMYVSAILGLYLLVHLIALAGFGSGQ